MTPRVLGGGKNMMLGNLIDLQFGQGRNWPLGAALSITLMAIVMVALLIYVKQASKAGCPPWLERIFSVRRQTGFTTIAIICFVMLYLPIADPGRLFLQCRAVDRRLGRLLLALVRVGLGERARSRKSRSARSRSPPSPRSSPPSRPPWRRSPPRARALSAA